MSDFFKMYALYLIYIEKKLVLKPMGAQLASLSKRFEAVRLRTLEQPLCCMNGLVLLQVLGQSESLIANDANMAFDFVGTHVPLQ